MVWSKLTTTYRLKNARIVASVSDGGGVVVEHRDIEFIEGRHPVTHGKHDGEEHGLDYMSSFGVAGAPAPEASQLIPARMVIEGAHTYGRVEIRGVGQFGYDDRGNPEGWFDVPPEILLDDMPEAPNDNQDNLETLTPEQWVERHKTIQPKLSAEYVRALRGRLDWDDDE